MIEKLMKAYVAGKLTTVMCRDKATHENVEILCLRVNGGLRPLARFYPDVDYANADVTVVEGHSESRSKLLH